MVDQVPASPPSVPAANAPQSSHKAWYAAIASAALSALLSAVVVTLKARNAEVGALWDWLWCSPENGIACPLISEAAAMKAIVESLASSWWTSLIAAAGTGPLTGIAVYFTNNRPK